MLVVIVDLIPAHIRYRSPISKRSETADGRHPDNWIGVAQLQHGSVKPITKTLLQCGDLLLKGTRVLGSYGKRNAAYRDQRTEDQALSLVGFHDERLLIYQWLGSQTEI